jgi:peptidyl-prolyl cis-trans isomerase SurA
MNSRRMRISFPASLCMLLGMFLFLQPAMAQQAQTADKILAIIGRSRIILQSELEAQAANLRQQSPEEYHDSMKCGILQQMILSKMLVEQAERDSIIVSNEEVEATLDNKLRYFITRVYGSKEKLEQVTGKTVYQIKDENREVVREQMLAERVQGQLLQNVAITPTEVRAFYNKIPADSLPFFPAAVEVGQIVIDPPVSPELDTYARKSLEEIRHQIVNEGKSFETMALMRSQDPGSRDNGGRYNDVSRVDGGWAPEFVAAAFKLQNGDVSPIVRTKFGYHIIQMVQRKGDRADVRHILIIPERTSADFKIALSRLDSVRAELMSGKLSFSQAVGKYSTDDMSKMTGGMIVDPQTNASQLEVDQLDPALALMVDSLEVGAYSQPHVFVNPQTGERSCRIVYLKSRTTPHKANLRDDYSKIQQVALTQKQNQKLEQWVRDKLPSYYLKIDPEYRDCSQFAGWKDFMHN